MNTPNTSRRVLLTCLVIAAIFSICIVAFAVVWGASALYQSRVKPSTLATSTLLAYVTPTSLPPEPSSTPAPTSTPLPTLPGGTPAPTQPSPTPRLAVVPPQIAAQMDTIQQQVIQYRGLQPHEQVNRGLLTMDQLRQRMVSDFEANYSQKDARDDAITYAAFGLLPPDFDLLTLYQNLYSEEVAGFYDDKTKEMYVVQGQGFGGNEKMTYAHEYTHFLQDQNYAVMKNLNNDTFCKKQSEYCAALQALIEGDATLSQFDWLYTEATQQDKNDVDQAANMPPGPVYQNAPAFLKDDFIFPYQQGVGFVQYLYKNGGWKQVDQAYRVNPSSTEQILHPERYPDDQPITVTLPSLSSIYSTGWREVETGTLGAWYSYLVLADGLEANARLSTTDAQAATNHWGGDAYDVYYNEQSKAISMVLKTVWDDATQSSQFVSAFKNYAGKRFGASAPSEGAYTEWRSSDGITRLYQNGAATIWILAPDAATADAIYKAVK